MEPRKRTVERGENTGITKNLRVHTQITSSFLACEYGLSALKWLSVCTSSIAMRARDGLSTMCSNHDQKAKYAHDITSARV